MAVIGYTKEELQKLMEMAVADLPFKSKYMAGKIVAKLEMNGIIYLGSLLRTPRDIIKKIKGFGPEMEMELFAALAKLAIYRDGREPK